MDKNANKVVDYYKFCEDDYKWLWRDRRSLGTHLGFWKENTKNHAESLIEQNKEMARIVKIEKKDFILDAGCGVGGTSFWLVNTYGSKIKAISISPKQINQAQKFSEKRKFNDLIDFSVQDYTKTNFPDNYFDIVWAQESIPHTENKEDFLKEAFRVLKKGGKLITSDYFIGESNQTKEEKILLKKWMGSWAMKNFVSPDEFLKKSKKAGFKKIKFYDTSKFVEPSLRRLKFISYVCLPVGILLETFGLRNDIQKANNRSGIWGYESIKKGLWKHGIIYAEK